MKVIEKYIKSIETDINCISPNFNNEDAINNALYFHMHTSNLFYHKKHPNITLYYYNLEDYVTGYYERHINDYMTNEFKTKRVKKISSAIATMIDKSWLSEFEHVFFDFKFKIYKRLRDCPNLVVARGISPFLYLLVHPREKQYLNTDFDINLYLAVVSVSSREELDSIKAIEIKKNILIQYLYNSIECILRIAYNQLNSIGLVKQLKNRIKLSEYLSAIHTCCNDIDFGTLLNKENSTRIDKNKLFITYCKAYPSREHNNDLLLLYLNKLRERLLIYQSSCNKTKFSALAYILFQNRGKLGLKPDCPKAFNKFKEILATYYDMPQNSLKPKNLKNEVDKLCRTYFCLGNINLKEFIKD